MIWLTWRQHRRQALFTLVGLVVLAALMIPTGLMMRASYADKGLAECLRVLNAVQPDPERARSCSRALSQFADQFSSMSLIGVLFLVLPLIVGLFWGAPLVAREVEQGTHRFAWTQGVGRRQWALVKFGFVAIVAVVVAVVYGLGMSWWATPLTGAAQQSRFDVFFFDMQGVAPIGYTLFAIALGVCAGVFWPRMMPAMAVTLGGFVGLRILLTVLARPHYLPPETRAIPIQGTIGEPGGALGDWILEKGIRNAGGRMVLSDAQAACSAATGPAGGKCPPIAEFGEGAYNWQLYQPADRFWLFQGIESGIFVALAAVLLYLAVRRIRRVA
ncbi:ABC transporter permease subunit [Micromonospora sp. NPDC005367]|uniref:ABC transporter permease subunit n=1 Tax=Micromonospora sp. NPDC005367 TaxID=3155590 RepID=UPI0033AFCAD2